MENIVNNFILNPSEQNAYILVKYFRCLDTHHTTVLIGKFLSKLYPNSLNIRSETAISAYYSQQFRLSYDLYSENLDYPILEEYEINQLLNNRSFSMKFITDDFTYYNKDLVDKICTHNINPIPIVTFTITSCKRLDLFEKTMNSFINCCIDINKIDKWFCVDDNSSDEDRQKMKKNYPFFTFYWKNINEKGHPRSMNIIRESVKTEYIFHIEDDWKFFHRKSYITDCMEVLLSDESIGQCLINRNYAETLDDTRIVGGYPNKTKRGIGYCVHEYAPDQFSKEAFINKYKSNSNSNNFFNCCYWPHFSFRPSLLKKQVLMKIGSYNENISHFEMNYSYKYVNNGYKSCFLNGIYCIHIGRLTSQINNKDIPNAYDLNDEKQFNGKEDSINNNNKFSICPSNVKTVVVNMDCRQDRITSFDKKSQINYERFSAVNGNKLIPNPQLQKIFEGNDYNMRTGIVGCALSHIKLYIELIQSENSDKNIYCIFEDDVSFGPNFKNQIEHIINNLPKKWDIIYLGYSLYPNYKTNDYYNTEVLPILEKADSFTSAKFMGGTYGYLITKEGALKFMEFINKTGMTNAIDTMQHKSISILETYYSYPHIVFADCALPNNTIDSDIQYNFKSLNLNDYIDEGKYPDRFKKNGVFDINDALIFSEY